MATDNSQSPSDADSIMRLVDQLVEHAREDDRMCYDQIPSQRYQNARDELRDAIARWGSPATVGEPVARVLLCRQGKPQSEPELLIGPVLAEVDVFDAMYPQRAPHRIAMLYPDAAPTPSREIPALTALTERGAVAWKDVDAQALREGRVPLTYVADGNYPPLPPAGFRASSKSGAVAFILDVAYQDGDPIEIYNADQMRAYADAARGITSKEGGPNAE